MYISTLRAKEGELRAIQKLQESNASLESFIPNLIISDASEVVLDTIQRKYLGKTLLDARDLNADEIETLEEILENDPERYEQFTIVYPVDIFLDVDEIDFSYEYIRISKKHINAFFIQWIKSNKLLLPENIIIDFEDIDDKVPATLIESVVKIVDALSGKQITISSGAIPTSVPVKSTENYNLPRYEKLLFKAINNETSADLIYGDYCTVSPTPFSSAGTPIPIVQLKYTLEDKYWFVRNGQRRGNYDFVAVCAEIVSSIEVFDPDYSWGDSYINTVVEENKNMGNPSVWVSVGVNHHIQVCLDEIT
ncbi:beta family protein [Enterococcus larvae]|uniref:beta family protein n=1 Tax=Enterococcus larvae TaxID=2794352 RepID=UPI003F3E3F3A